MGLANFIKKRFIGKEICISCGEMAETLTFAETWATNKELLYGTVEDVEDEVIVLLVPGSDLPIYINSKHIISFWEPGLDYHKIVRTSLTSRMFGANRKV